MRLLALFLALTMTGPSVTSLVCDWACAAKHQVVTASVGGCHEHAAEVRDAASVSRGRSLACPAAERRLQDRAQRAAVARAGGREPELRRLGGRARERAAA